MCNAAVRILSAAAAASALGCMGAGAGASATARNPLSGETLVSTSQATDPRVANLTISDCTQWPSSGALRDRSELVADEHKVCVSIERARIARTATAAMQAPLPRVVVQADAARASVVWLGRVGKPRLFGACRAGGRLHRVWIEQLSGCVANRGLVSERTAAITVVVAPPGRGAARLASWTLEGAPTRDALSAR